MSTEDNVARVVYVDTPCSAGDASVHWPQEQRRWRCLILYAANHMCFCTCGCLVIMRAATSALNALRQLEKNCRAWLNFIHGVLASVLSASFLSASVLSADSVALMA